MPLHGVKVIELAGLAPVPFCGMVLKEFGATVIRVDKVGSIDSALDCLGNGKRSIALDLKKSSAVKILKKLCQTSDVLIEPFRPGVMEKLGLAPDVLLSENPKLIYARLTGFGQTGKYAPRAGHDINYVALSGILSLLGRKGEKPTTPVNLLADFAGGGLICALGITLALLERMKSGKGQIIDASMVEGAAYVGSWLSRSQDLFIWGNKRGQNVLDTGAHFYDTYETKDGKFMSVGALEPQFYTQLLKGLGLQLDDVAQFTDFEKNSKLFESKFLEKTQSEWCEIFDSVDACVTPVLSLDEAALHPHNFERETFVTGTEFKHPVPKPFPLLSRTPGVSHSMEPRPLPGQHTREILQDLQFSAEEINQFEREQAACISSKL